MKKMPIIIGITLISFFFLVGTAKAEWWNPLTWPLFSSSEMTTMDYPAEECINFNNETIDNVTTYYFNDRIIEINSDLANLVYIDCFNGSHVWLSYANINSKVNRIHVEQYLDYHNGSYDLVWESNININKGQLNNLDPVDIENYMYHIGEASTKIKSSKYDEVVEALPISKRANKKADIYKKLNIEYMNYTLNGITFELINLTVIQGGIAVYIRAWNGTKPIGFGENGIVEIERMRIYNPPIKVETNETFLEYNNYTLVNDTIHKHKVDIKNTLIYSIVNIIQKVGSNGSNIITGKTGNTTSTIYPSAGYASASNNDVDGMHACIWGGGTDFTSITNCDTSHNFVLNEPSSYVDIIRVRSNNGDPDTWYEIYKGAFGFNTSIIGSDTISTATLSFHGRNPASTSVGDNEIYITSFQPNNPDLWAGVDYFTHTNTSLSDTNMNVSEWDNEGYNDFDLNNDGIDFINIEGVSYFSIQTRWQIERSYDGTWVKNTVTGFNSYMADQSGTTSDPMLVIEHSAGADTCTYSSGNWNIDCGDNCSLSSFTNLGGNNVFAHGSGTVENLRKYAYNYAGIYIYGGCEALN